MAPYLASKLADNEPKVVGETFAKGKAHIGHAGRFGDVENG